MSTKLYVGNLAYATMEEDVQALFGQAGTVLSCEVVLDKFTKKSRGFAFVEMSSPEEAEQAVEKFNDYELEGRRLVVNVARPRDPRPFGGYPPSGYGHGGRDGGSGGKRKSGKGSRRNARNAKRQRKAAW